MRLLFLTNFFPPASRGGYDQWCHEVAIGMQNLGHDVVVLTSRHDRRQIGTEAPWIERELHLEMEFASLRNGLDFFINRKARERQNLATVRETVESWAPDAALIWGMWNLQRTLPALLEKLLPGRVVYYMGDYWPTLPSQFTFYWQSTPRNLWTALPKRLLGAVARRQLAREVPPVLGLERIIFPTQFMYNEFKRQGFAPREAPIVYGAIDTSLYAGNGHDTQHAAEPHNGTGNDNADAPLTLLYAGRLTAEKGVHTAIEALSILIHQYNHRLQLKIVGTGDTAYENRLHQLVARHDLQPFVHFLGRQPKAHMPALYRQADILLFTSVWDEPFGRVPVEAMASGLVVIGTATGGAAEILHDNENALVFPAGDSTALADQVVRVIQEPTLRRRLAQNARQMAVEKFDVHRMSTEIASYLQKVIDESEQ